METGINIDLNNLEDVKFESSKYVLTSPRSLEACSRLYVKPVELLYKPLAEFQEELLPQDVPLSTIYDLYDEREHIRQKKLQLCREERSRLIREGTQLKGNKVESNTQSDAARHGRLMQKSSQKEAKRVISKENSTSRLQTQDKESAKLHRELVSKKESRCSKLTNFSSKRPQSAERKTQRCSPSVTLGTKVVYRSGSAPSSVKLPARDEKILKLMKDRREKEQENLSRINQTHQIWEDQKLKEKIFKITAESKRRELLAEESRLKSLHKLETNESKEKEEDFERQWKQLQMRESDFQTELLQMNTLRKLELQLSDKIRKQSRLNKIKELNQMSAEFKADQITQMLLSKQISDLESASEKKDVRIHQEHLRKFLENRQEREQFEQRKKFLQLQEKQNEDLVRSSMEIRLNQAEANLDQILNERKRLLEEYQRQEKAKLKRAQTAHKRSEEESKELGLTLLEHKKLIEARALETVNRSIELKALLAQKQRRDKEIEHQKNLSRLQKEEEKWRRALERSLLEKDRKIDELLEEKEKLVSQTRAMAQLSQTLRDDIKEKYQSDTFDKKVLEAQLYANLEKKQMLRSATVTRK
ncbi:coiled-coil domain-containing protein 177 isoform X1 [Biomphalaria pfeifferi]|uniref:Coiled-coil domain-containing protein 177 isoform X1 n=1 Tax=Biomphalaria pfeifferi TaxID=112525 RepID=A0AAD8B7M6_BIOPF|nr:coiled-coil domain-containing protein 177 isoform X1 [Biomphalaria pfeifferi]